MSSPRPDPPGRGDRARLGIGHTHNPEAALLATTRGTSKCRGGAQDRAPPRAFLRDGSLLVPTSSRAATPGSIKGAQSSSKDGAHTSHMEKETGRRAGAPFPFLP